MFERQGQKETSQDRLRTAYKGFKNLAKKYGQPDQEGGLVFPRVYTSSNILSENCDDEQGEKCDFIQGKDFGEQANTVEIFFRKETEAEILTLETDSKGNVLVSDVKYLKSVPVEGKPNILVRETNTDREPDIVALNEIIEKTSRFLAHKKDIRREKLRFAASMRRVHTQESIRKNRKNTN